MLSVRKNISNSATATFDAITGGYVSKDMLIACDGPSIILGNEIATSPFYFEVYIAKAQTLNFMICFVDRGMLSVNYHDWRFLGLD
jgi:hypothetical protein